MSGFLHWFAQRSFFNRSWPITVTANRIGPQSFLHQPPPPGHTNSTKGMPGLDGRGLMCIKNTHLIYYSLRVLRWIGCVFLPLFSPITLQRHPLPPQYLRRESWLSQGCSFDLNCKQVYSSTHLHYMVTIGVYRRYLGSKITLFVLSV